MNLVLMTEPDTKENIVNASFRQFIERSYHKVSIDSICSESGVSKGAVFHYFNSKYTNLLTNLPLTNINSGMIHSSNNGIDELQRSDEIIFRQTTAPLE